MNKSSEKLKQPEKPGADEYECPICKDTELVLKRDEWGYEFASFCECRERKAWKRRFKQALIPDEFIHANFENFKRSTQYQQDMYDATISYLNEFAVIKHDNGTTKKILSDKNLGFIAVVGEQRLRELPAGERAEAKRQHNNFGVGKNSFTNCTGQTTH